METQVRVACHVQCRSKLVLSVLHPVAPATHTPHCITALPNLCTNCVQELLPFTRDVLGRPLIMLAKNPTVRQSAHPPVHATSIFWATSSKRLVVSPDAVVG